MFSLAGLTAATCLLGGNDLMNSHHRTVIGAAAAMLAAVAIAPSVAAASTATAEDPVDMAVAWQPGALISAMDWFADANGIFTERGLNVTLLQTANGPAAAAAGIIGDVDVFYGPQSNFVEPSKQGECFNVVSSGQRSPINIIAGAGVDLPHAGEPYPSALVDLAGMAVGVPVIGSSTDHLTRLVLADAGITEDAVDFVATGVGATAVAALTNDQVQVLAAFPPMEQLLADDEYQMVAELVGDPASPLYEQITSHQVVTCDYAAENPVAVERYCQAWWDAWEWSQDTDNSEAAGAIVAEYLGVESDVGVEIWNQYSVTYQDPVLTEELWNRQADFNASGGGEVLPYADWVVADCAAADPRA